MLFHGVAYHKHYNFTKLLWKESVDVVALKSQGNKANKFLPYPRFLRIFIVKSMNIEHTIHRREEEPTIPERKIGYLRKDDSAANIQSAPIPESLLSLSQQTSPNVIGYRNSVAHMVQPEPVGPSQGATLVLGSEGLGIVGGESSVEGGMNMQLIKSSTGCRNSLLKWSG